MVLVGTPGLYHFAGSLVEVPENGEVTVEEESVAKAMQASGFKPRSTQQPKKATKE